MRTHRDIIDLWPTKQALADDLGISSDVVRKWYQFDSIPGWWWFKISSIAMDLQYMECKEDYAIDHLAYYAYSRHIGEI